MFYQYEKKVLFSLLIIMGLTGCSEAVDQVN